MSDLFSQFVLRKRSNGRWAKHRAIRARKTAQRLTQEPRSAVALPGITAQTTTPEACRVPVSACLRYTLKGEWFLPAYYRLRFLYGGSAAITQTC